MAIAGIDHNSFCSWHHRNEFFSKTAIDFGSSMSLKYGAVRESAAHLWQMGETVYDLAEID